ncbi:hypothetical protein TNCV_4845251 [Trichonephila clavipes]|uniref:Uncharacterized protein n=1 Tax=Trichonephila clavipes TaxID=2585209 RepID=A0A8X7BM38_TRICX|nr:hypothetical protein TNCV_4845251 [Trichonephila clavipes]
MDFPGQKSVWTEILWSDLIVNLMKVGCVEESSVESICLWVSEQKRAATTNCLRNNSTAVLPKGGREKSPGHFERKKTSGDSIYL